MQIVVVTTFRAPLDAIEHIYKRIILDGYGKYEKL